MSTLRRAGILSREGARTGLVPDLYGQKCRFGKASTSVAKLPFGIFGELRFLQDDLVIQNPGAAIGQSAAAAKSVQNASILVDRDFSSAFFMNESALRVAKRKCRICLIQYVFLGWHMYRLDFRPQRRKLFCVLYDWILPIAWAVVVAVYRYRDGPGFGSALF